MTNSGLFGFPGPGSASPADRYYPTAVYIDTFMSAYDHSGWASNTVDNSCVLNAYRATASAVPTTNYVTFSATLAQGIWTFETMYVKSSNAGILTLSLDGMIIGSQDSYAAAISRNNVWSLTGVQVPSSGLHLFTYATPTKNGSSSGNAGYLQRIKLTKTG